MDGQQFLKEFLAAGMKMAQDTKEDGFATLTDKKGNTYVAQMNESEKTRYKETGKKLSQVKKEQKEAAEKKSEKTDKETKRDVVDHLVKLGGKLWNDKRIYIKDIAKDWLEVNADFYNTGNLRSFEWIEGKESNSQGNRILSAIGSSYFDIPSRTFKAESYSRPELAQKVVDMLTKEAREQGLDVNDPIKREPKKEPEILKPDYGQEADRIREIVKKTTEQDVKKAEESDFVKNYPRNALNELFKDPARREKLAAIINNTKFANAEEFRAYLQKYHAGISEDLHTAETRASLKSVQPLIGGGKSDGEEKVDTKTEKPKTELTGKKFDYEKFVVQLKNTVENPVVGANAYLNSKLLPLRKQELEYIEKNKPTKEQFVEWLNKSGLKEKSEEIRKKYAELKNKFSANYWNKKIYKYSNGQQAVFLNGKKTILTEEEIEYLNF